jgi:hypothetical protein
MNAMNSDARRSRSVSTETRQLRIYVRPELRETPLPRNFSFDAPADAQRALVGIGPKGQIRALALDIKGTDLVAIRQETKFFYIWGVATYGDVFGDSPMHVTRFRFQATNITGNPIIGWDDKANPVGIDFRHYEQNNCEDNDCQVAPPAKSSPASPQSQPL